MQTALRKIGNSTGMILPKPFLQALGVECGAKMELALDNGRVIVTPVKRKVREGWEEDAKIIGALPLTEEEQDWMAFGNEADDDWVW